MMTPDNVFSPTEAFQTPPSKYGLVPFWSWNGEMDEARMIEQMRAMKEQGIREFIVMAFWPLTIPYCEGEWWDRVETTLRFCRDNGMRAWIYDDYAWPSGACGGKLLRDKPWTRNVVMGCKVVEVQPGETFSARIDGELVAANAVIALSQVIDVLHAITAQVNRGEATTTDVEWRNESSSTAKLCLFARAVCDELLNFGVGAPWSWQQRGYLNTLDPKAVGAFIESTYEEYAKRFGQYFGKEMVGFFTDEPALSYYGTPYEGSAYPYTHDLFESFAAKYGYDLRSRIAELLEDIGDFRKTRHDYWSHVTSVFTTSYHKTLRQWCDGHSLLLTGHAVWEESLGWNIVHSGDISEGNKHYHVPGFDLLQTNTSFDDKFMENSIHFAIEPGALAVTAKIESSTARHAGAQRTLCEAYGVPNWAHTMEDQRKVTDWITALGTNLIVDCLLPYSTHGFPRYRVCGKNFYSPWWKYYGMFNSYAARMSMIAAECELKTEIGIVFPTTSSWCLFDGDLRKNFILARDNPPWTTMQKSLVLISDGLLRNQWDYDLIFDGVFPESQVQDGRFIAPHSSYSVLILPGVTTLTPLQAKMIESFVRSGGRLVLLGAIPEFSTDGTVDVAQMMEALMKSDNVTHLPLTDSSADTMRAVDGLLKGLLDKEIVVTGESSRSILKAHRVWNGLDVVLLGNQSDQWVKVEIVASLAGPLQVWDNFSGERYAANRGGKPSQPLTYEFAPHESIFLVAGAPDNGALQPLHRKSWRFQEVVERKTLEGPWTFSPENGNMLLPDWMVRPDVDGRGEELGWGQSNEDEGWSPSRWCEAEMELDPDAMKGYWLKTRINVTELPGNFGIITDTKSEYPAIYANGNQITANEPCTLWDPDNVRFEIAEHLVVGENTIVVQARIPAINRRETAVYLVDYKDVAPVVLTGDFVVGEDGSIEAARGPRANMTTGSWHVSGYPNYSGTATYSRELDLPELAEGESLWLDLGKVADAAEVWLNGQHVATLPLHPYEADLTKWVVAGINRLEIRVTNNFANLLFGFWTGKLRRYTPAGLLADPVVIRTR